MSDSILTSVKQMLGITEEYEYFDPQLIMHINSVFMVLNQLGVGPDTAFTISDKTATWSDFVGCSTDALESVKTYVYAKARLMFDPPQSSVLMECTNRLISELEWRLKTETELGRIAASESGYI